MEKEINKEIKEKTKKKKTKVATYAAKWNKAEKTYKIEIGMKKQLANELMQHVLTASEGKVWDVVTGKICCEGTTMGRKNIMRYKITSLLYAALEKGVRDDNLFFNIFNTNNTLLTKLKKHKKIYLTTENYQDIEECRKVFKNVIDFLSEEIKQKQRITQLNVVWEEE